MERAAVTDAPDLTLDAKYLLYGFEYALGRDMMADVRRVSEDLITHVRAIPPEWRKRIVQDITNHIERGTAGGSAAIDEWLKVKKAMTHV